MIKLENLTDHRKEIKLNDWSKLFDLIPDMNQNKPFGKIGDIKKQPDGVITMPYYESSPVVNNSFWRLFMNWIFMPEFDWMGWTEWQKNIAG